MNQHLSSAILSTVVYADVFDQALALQELHRYLHGVRISMDALLAELDGGSLSGLPIARTGDSLTLLGREDLVEMGLDRRRRFDHLWPEAVRWGRRAGSFPFVRMVALTGSLAMRSADGDGDIDYLIVAQDGRVWTCRLGILLLVRIAARRGIALCPNYFLTPSTLALNDHSIYTARELTQMIPLSSMQFYEKMRLANPWADQLLPNAGGPPPHTRQTPRRSRFKPLVESPFRGRIGDRVESWEMARKLQQFTSRPDTSSETGFDAHHIQGHFNAHRARTLQRFERRLQEITQAL